MELTIFHKIQIIFYQGSFHLPKYNEFFTENRRDYASLFAN